MIIKLKYDVRDKHVHARIFMGLTPDQTNLCGNLLFSKEEFNVFQNCLTGGSLFGKDVKVLITSAADGSSSSYPRIQPPPQ